MRRQIAGCLLCLGLTGILVWARPVGVWASQVSYPLEDLGEDFDQEELERELREILEEGGADEIWEPDEGEPVIDEEILEELARMKKIVHPPLKTRWSEENSMMVYTAPNQSSFRSSVPDGMTTTLPVTFLPMENARVTLRRDGMKFTPAEDGVCREAGSYHINLLVLPNGNESGDNNLYEIDFYFRILPERSRDISLLKAPEGFYIERLERDKTAFRPENPQWHFLNTDGSYRVRFVDEQTGQVAFETSFVRDTRAPLLLFDPPPDRREMRTTLHLETDDPGAGIEMYYNGKPSKTALKTIDIAGYYQYHLTDSAGNERFYAVRLAERFQMPGRKQL